MNPGGIISSATLERARRLAYWGLPPLLLFCVFRRIDFALFWEDLKGVNPWLFILGVGLFPLLVLIAGVRWKVTMSTFFGLRIPLPYLIKHYWIGMGVGFLSPGQIGLDVYRTIVIGRRYGYYMQTIFAVLVEKCMALLNAVMLVICLCPFARQLSRRDDPVLDLIVNTSYVLALGMLVAMAGAVIVARHRVGHRFVNGVSALMLRSINRMKSVIGTDAASQGVADLPGILKRFSTPKPLLLVLLASLGIMLVSAVGNQVAFRAVGYEIPILLNLFVVPIFYFIFLLPISFGTLGVREGAYVLLYGLFGVPSEVALLVSFMSLCGTLLNMAVAAVLSACAGRVDRHGQERDSVRATN